MTGLPRNNFRKVAQLLTTVNSLYNSHKIAKVLTNFKLLYRALQSQILAIRMRMYFCAGKSTRTCHVGYACNSAPLLFGPVALTGHSPSLPLLTQFTWIFYHYQFILWSVDIDIVIPYIHECELFSGGSRISLTGGWHIVPENFMKMKKFGPRGRSASPCAPLDPPLLLQLNNAIQLLLPNIGLADTLDTRPQSATGSQRLPLTCH